MRGVGAGTRAHLFSGRRAGTAPPRALRPPELRHRTAGPGAVPVPGPAPGDVSVHTYTHGGGRGSEAPNFSPLPCAPGEGGGRGAGVLGERALTGKEKMGRIFMGFAGGGDFFFFNHFHEMAAESREPGAGW